MTDLEYKELAQKVVEEFMQDDTDEDCSQDICVNHIGEVFLLKIREAFTLLDEKEFPHNGADRLTKMALNTFNNKRNDELNNIGSLPPCDNDIVYANISLFLGIQSAIKNHSNPEYMLQGLGIENPQEIIILIKNAESTRDIDNLFDLIFEINQKLLSIVGYDRLIKLSLWGILNLSVRKMIQFCKEESYEDFLEVSKTAKEIGEKYASICEKRVTSIYYRFKALFDKDNSNKDLISENFIPQETALASFLIYIYEVEYNDTTDSLFEELVPKYALLDFFFIFYYFIYKQPQHIVKLGFTFMSDKVSYNIREAMFSTFQKEDYAALIQYEYEWWCKETGEKLSLPFPFFEGVIDLKDINIIDYNLSNSSYNIKTLPSSNIENTNRNITDEEYERQSNNNTHGKRERKYDHLPFSPVIGKFFLHKGRKIFLIKLYDKLKNDYIKCPIECFCHIFGYIETDNNEKNDKSKENHYINWLYDKQYLQYLILKLYREDDKKQIKRNTWTKVEDCFLLDGKQIPSQTMKLQTNHIPNSCKTEIDTIISNVVKEAIEQIHSTST